MNDSFISGEPMILRTSDLNQNFLARGYSGMESLKQAMLQHELIFRSQVRELRRLYWTQKSLMNELHRQWFDAHAPSSSSRVAMTKWKGLTEVKKEFSESSCAREFKGRHAEVFSNHVINFIHHLPADKFVTGSCVDLLYSHTGIEVSKGNEIVVGTEKDKIGCGFEEVITEKVIPRSASSFSCKEMIDLEAKLEFECHDKANEVFFGLRAPLQKDKGMLWSQTALLSDQVSSSTVVNEMHQTPSMVHLGERQDGRLQDQKPAISFAGIIQDKPVLIDLNLPLEDECSLALDDPAEDINIKHFSSVAHDGILKHNQSNQVEAAFIPEPVSSISITKVRSDNHTDCLSCHDQGSKPFRSPEFELILDATEDKGDTDIKIGSNKNMAFSCQVQVDFCGKPAKGSTNNRAFINVNDVSFSSINSYDQAKVDLDFSSDKLLSAVRSDSKRQDSNVTSSNSTNLPQPLIRDSVNELGSYDGSEGDSLSNHAFAQEVAQRYALSRKFPTGCNSASKTRNTMSMSQDKIVEEPDTLSKTDDSVTTQLNSSQNDGSSMEKPSIEQDLTIAAAAEALMGLSSERLSFPIDHQREVDCNSGNNQPLHSSDSFECEALQLSEVQSEHRFSISEPLNRTERETNVNGLRLRRGKGLRDFQKEILPGLASLARHEICEDMHNIGHKLRRTASRNARVNCFVAVQGRRPSLYSGLQRN